MILAGSSPVAGGAPTLQSASNFNTSYNQVCGAGAENSTACLNLVYNEVRSHFAYTDYLNKENEAVEAELARLARPMIKQAVVPLGVDPKSVLCEFFKVRGGAAAAGRAPPPTRAHARPPPFSQAGVCEKGAKCKYARFNPRKPT